MTWDRFDDAHDDLRDDIFATQREIEKLQKSLDNRSVEYQPLGSPKPQNESGPQGWYEDTQREDLALSSYADYLRKLLEDASEDDKSG